MPTAKLASREKPLAETSYFASNSAQAKNKIDAERNFKSSGQDPFAVRHVDGSADQAPLHSAPEAETKADGEAQVEAEKQKPQSLNEILGEKLLHWGQEFSEKVAGKYSTFEFLMSVVHAIANKGRAGSLAYVGTTFGEFINNVYFAAGKKLPAFLGKPLVSCLSKLFNLKDEDGKALNYDKVGGKGNDEGNADKVTGALITFMTRSSLAYTIIKPILSLFKSKKDPDDGVQKITFLNSFAQIWGPLANWWAMWSSSIGKMALGSAAHKLTGKHLEGMGSLKGTGMEDIYCGLSSGSLAVDSLLSTISPFMSKASELISGLGLSLFSMNNAAEMMGRNILGKELPEEEEEKDFPLPKLWQGAIGDFVYKTTEPIAKMLGLEIPKWHDLKQIITGNLNNLSGVKETLLNTALKVLKKD